MYLVSMEEGNIRVSIILWRGVFIRQINATDALRKKMLSASYAVYELFLWCVSYIK